MLSAHGLGEYHVPDAHLHDGHVASHNTAARDSQSRRSSSASSRPRATSGGRENGYTAYTLSPELAWLAADNYLERRIDSSDLLPVLTCCLT